jgi:hypothetical protein
LTPTPTPTSRIAPDGWPRAERAKISPFWPDLGGELGDAVVRNEPAEAPQAAAFGIAPA